MLRASLLIKLTSALSCKTLHIGEHSSHFFKYIDTSWRNLNGQFHYRYCSTCVSVSDPVTNSKEFIYANDLALVSRYKKSYDIERTLKENVGAKGKNLS